MIRDFSRKYYEVWGTEQAQNVFLKGLLTVISLLFCIQSVALVIVSLRKPVLIGVSDTETKILAAVPPFQAILDQELKRQVTRYVQTHYTWDHATIDKAHA